MSSKSEWWSELWAAFTRSGPYSPEWSAGRERGYREGFEAGVAEERARWEADMDAIASKLKGER
jgi:hypothetical protein